MNKYIIAAIYVMAGCITGLPLNLQGNGNTVSGERYRLVNTTEFQVRLNFHKIEDVFQKVFEKKNDYSVSDDLFVSKEKTFCKVYKPVKKDAVSAINNRIRAPGLTFLFI